MDNHKLLGWGQLVVVFVGVALVIYELNQTRTLSRMQLAADGYAERLADQRAILSETFSEVLAKACADPSELSSGELEQMNAWHTILLLEVGKTRRIQTLGNFDYPWQLSTRGIIRELLSTQVGLDFFERNPQRGGFENIAIELIESGESLTCEISSMPRSKVGDA